MPKPRLAAWMVAAGTMMLVAGVALFASVLGGVAGYGTGALMPLVLVFLMLYRPRGIMGIASVMD